MFGFPCRVARGATFGNQTTESRGNRLLVLAQNRASTSMFTGSMIMILINMNATHFYHWGERVKSSIYICIFHFHQFYVFITQWTLWLIHFRYSYHFNLLLAKLILIQNFQCQSESLYIFQLTFMHDSSIGWLFDWSIVYGQCWSLSCHQLITRLQLMINVENIG